MLCYAAVHLVRRQHQALQAPPIWQLSVITAAVTTSTYSRIQQQARDGTTMMAEADMSTIKAPPGVWWTYDNDESMRAPPGGVCLALLSRFNCQLVVAAAAAAAIVDYRWTSQERRSRGGSLWELESRPPSVRYRKGPRYDLSESTAAAACGSWSLQHWTCADVCMLICQYCSYSFNCCETALCKRRQRNERGDRTTKRHTVNRFDSVLFWGFIRSVVGRRRRRRRRQLARCPDGGKKQWFSTSISDRILSGARLSTVYRGSSSSSSSNRIRRKRLLTDSLVFCLPLISHVLFRRVQRI